MLVNLVNGLFPILSWGPDYSVSKLREDVIAGIVVLFITVPQVIAYAFLAGMPAEAGLYAAIVSLVAYTFFGSSKALAVGPTAVIAMMTLQVASEYGIPGTPGYQLLATKLCLLTGIVLLGLRLLNFGSLVSFLSHAVTTGFVTAAAILIMGNQIPSLLGVPDFSGVTRGNISNYFLGNPPGINLTVVSVSLIAIVVLVFCRYRLGSLLRKAGVTSSVAETIAKTGPMLAVVVGTNIVCLLGESSVIPVVGFVPATLPNFSPVQFEIDEIVTLLPSAFLIALVCFMESFSIGNTIASKSRDKIEPNQELVGLGVANFSAGLVGGFPVAGSFARTIVNFSAGAVSPIASLITAGLLIGTLLGFASWFHDLPRAVLSAIVVVSAWQLIDFKVVRKILQYNTEDAITFAVTFFSVLVVGVETGIAAGIAVSFILLIRNSSRPHIAVVGRVGDSEHFRHKDRYPTHTSFSVLAVRVDESLYFANSRFVENDILHKIAEMNDVEHVLLICSSINFIDTSGLEMLEELSDGLAEAGLSLHLAEVKTTVFKKLQTTDFYDRMQGEVFFTTDLAMKKLGGI